MSEICTRTQAKNIVEYVWRKRNHNDDIPRQYLTDMLVDCIAQSLALAREEGRAELAAHVKVIRTAHRLINALIAGADGESSDGEMTACMTDHQDACTELAAIMGTKGSTDE